MDLQSEIKGALTYLYHETFKITTYKLIEIESETSLIEHMQFNHQYYVGDTY